MTCQNCGAPLRLDRDQGIMLCDYCGSQETPPADEDGVQVLDPSKHTCPVCHTALNEGRIETHDLLYCTTCHGMLISMDDILTLLEGLRSHRDRAAAYLPPRDQAAQGRTLSCPLCEHPMDRHEYGGGGNVMVDSCEDCSQLWLDRGELRRIVSAPDPAASFDRETVYSNYADAGKFGAEER